MTRFEILHYHQKFQPRRVQALDGFKRNKQLYLLVLLYDLGDYMHQIDGNKGVSEVVGVLDDGPNLDITSGGSWNVLLVADVVGVKAQYTPKSGASLFLNKFPHLVLEIISNSSELDRIRMLVQAACLARLGNIVLCRPLAPPFVASAICLDDDLFAIWYQPRTKECRCKVDLAEVRISVSAVQRCFVGERRQPHST